MRLLLPIMMQGVVLRSTRLIAVLAPRRPRFQAGPVHVGFVMDHVANGQVLPREILFSPLSMFPTMLHPHSFIIPQAT
jgi:hypothetical protein